MSFLFILCVGVVPKSNNILLLKTPQKNWKDIWPESTNNNKETLTLPSTATATSFLHERGQKSINSIPSTKLPLANLSKHRLSQK